MSLNLSPKMGQSFSTILSLLGLITSFALFGCHLFISASDSWAWIWKHFRWQWAQCRFELVDLTIYPCAKFAKFQLWLCCKIQKKNTLYLFFFVQRWQWDLNVYMIRYKRLKPLTTILSGLKLLHYWTCKNVFITEGLIGIKILGRVLRRIIKHNYLLIVIFFIVFHFSFFFSSIIFFYYLRMLSQFLLDKFNKLCWLHCSSNNDMWCFLVQIHRDNTYHTLTN